MKYVSFILSLLFLVSCKQQPETVIIPSENSNEVSYATGFTISHFEDYTLLKVTAPWPESDISYTYALVKDDTKKIDTEVDAVIKVPLQSIVVTSTTHIPSLEMLGVENTLLGFPNLDYISSINTRKLISENKIKELGKNESLNVEVLIDLQPDAVIGFAVDGANSSLTTIKKTGIPVLYNGDWTETHPLGKAEWLKFFGVLFDQEEKANQLFKDMETEYQRVKVIASQATQKPSVISGAMYKDVWYAPQGDSWAAQFIADANANYLWQDTQGTGSLAIPLETAFDKGQQAQLWMGPGQFTSYDQLAENNKVYTKFDAFTNRQVYSFASTKGATGGVVYYELAPNRPDIVLKDMVKIIHPSLLPDHELFFFKPLN